MTSNEGGMDLSRLLTGFDAAEKAKAQHRQLEQLLVELLGIADALHELERHLADLERKGVQDVPRRSIEIVLRKLLTVLKSHQVERMDCKGQPFDLERHEVLEVKPVRGMSDDIVLEECVHGYMWHPRVLRHAKVIISRAEAVPEPVGKRAKRRKRKQKPQQ